MVRDTDLRRRVSSQASKRVFSLSIIGDVIAELNRVTWPTRDLRSRATRKTNVRSHAAFFLQSAGGVCNNKCHNSESAGGLLKNKASECPPNQRIAPEKASNS